MSFPSLLTRYIIAGETASDVPGMFPLLIGQSFLVSKRQIWSTAITTASNGRERRRSLWSYPKWSFKVSYEVLRDRPTQRDVDRLVTFFNIQAGRRLNFTFYDPGDNTVEAQQFGTGDGVTTQFQLIRSKTFAGEPFDEPVRAVVGEPMILLNGAVVALSSTSINTGLVTFATPPATGATLTWSGQFLFLCRFDQDDLDLTQMMEGLWSQSGLSFMTDRR
ncbi:hypothetical protein GCM10008023_06010 [Sphingomonas glacialis]|uniref:DUF2460 domain-containing protein n=1 Tax=Sphingomonas glacialis TaxID=658225 RepID=A0ABQ3LBS5_9SPHN|nr:DUF2460 domain-containing protein [Sphingomonas glacialis]GHH09387.1 hypothetical protein GCM10008023_06010 [Sphingomonas glacialis]